MAGTEQRPEGTPRRNTEPDERPAASVPGVRAVPLDLLRPYAEAVLAGLAENRDLRSEDGKPCYRVQSSGEDKEASWLQIVADFSAIGMATDMPLIVTAFADDASLEWNFGPTPIGKSPRTATPKAAADALDMNVLLDGFRRFVAAESVLFPTSVTKDAGKIKGPVAIDPADCTCSECGEALEVTDVDDVTMSVERGNGHAYELEHDAFDAGFDYVLEFLSRRGSASA